MSKNEKSCLKVEGPDDVTFGTKLQPQGNMPKEQTTHDTLIV